MLIVRQDGLRAARDLLQDIYEVEAHGIDHSYRLVFSSEGRKGRFSWPSCCSRRRARGRRNESSTWPGNAATTGGEGEPSEVLTISVLTDIFAPTLGG